MCIILRQETEWTELVTNGYNKLAGYSESAIYEAYKDINTHSINFEKSYYGNGNACKIILKSILEHHSIKKIS